MSASSNRAHRALPAGALGLTAARCSWAQVFARRLFFHHVPLTGDEQTIYRNLAPTPMLPAQRPHNPLYVL